MDLSEGLFCLGVGLFNSGLENVTDVVLVVLEFGSAGTDRGQHFVDCLGGYVLEGSPASVADLVGNLDRVFTGGKRRELRRGWRPRDGSPDRR